MRSRQRRVLHSGHQRASACAPDPLRSLIEFLLQLAVLELPRFVVRLRNYLADATLAGRGMAPLRLGALGLGVQLLNHSVLLAHGLADARDEGLVVAHPADPDAALGALLEGMLILLEVTAQLEPALLGFEQGLLQAREPHGRRLLLVADHLADDLEAVGALHRLHRLTWQWLVSRWMAAGRPWSRRAAQYWWPNPPARACPDVDRPRSAASARWPHRLSGQCRADRRRWRSDRGGAHRSPPLVAAAARARARAQARCRA